MSQQGLISIQSYICLSSVVFFPSTFLCQINEQYLNLDFLTLSGRLQPWQVIRMGMERRLRRNTMFVHVVRTIGNLVRLTAYHAIVRHADPPYGWSLSSWRPVSGAAMNGVPQVRTRVGVRIAGRIIGTRLREHTAVSDADTVGLQRGSGHRRGVPSVGPYRGIPRRRMSMRNVIPIQGRSLHLSTMKSWSSQFWMSTKTVRHVPISLWARLYLSVWCSVL